MINRYYAVFIYIKHCTAVNLRLPITAATCFCSENKTYTVKFNNPIINMVMAADDIFGGAELAN